MISVRNWCSNFYLKFKNESFMESYFLKWDAFAEQVFQNNEVNLYFSFILFETLLPV